MMCLRRFFGIGAGLREDRSGHQFSVESDQDYAKFGMGSNMFRQILSISVIRKFAYFSGVGAIATGVQYVILIVLVQGFGATPVRASGIGFVTSAVVNYMLNYYITFESRKAHSEAATKFIVIAALGLTLNSLIMHLGTDILTIHYVLTQLVATGSVLVWNFTGNYLWSFREKSKRRTNS